MTSRQPSALQADIGHVFQSRPKRLSFARILAFSGGPFDAADWPHKNLHTDKAKAREAGLDSIIASGTQSEGILIALLVEVCGTAWHSNGTLDVRFVKSVHVNETITAYARLRNRQDGTEAPSLAFDVWCANSAGDSVIAGTAAFRTPI
ncbi:MAG: MaoC family dehydratase [Hyphomicrobiaceae bacterium]